MTIVADCPSKVQAVEPEDAFEVREQHLERSVGLALGGEAGARLIERLSMPTSADTMLRKVCGDRQGVTGTPRILGVDDSGISSEKLNSAMLFVFVITIILGLKPLIIGAWCNYRPDVLDTA